MNSSCDRSTGAWGESGAWEDRWSHDQHLPFMPSRWPVRFLEQAPPEQREQFTGLVRDPRVGKEAPIVWLGWVNIKIR